LIREFRLAPPECGRGVSCDANGAFVGAVALLQRPNIYGEDLWEPRDYAQISEQLGLQFGLPIDVSKKAGGLKAICNALNEGDVARAQIAAVLLGIPELPTLAKGVRFDSDMIKFIRDLHWSGLIKADWDPDEHPRWPAGAPESQGGQFAPTGENSTDGSNDAGDASTYGLGGGPAFTAQSVSYSLLVPPGYKPDINNPRLWIDGNNQEYSLNPTTNVFSAIVPTALGHTTIYSDGVNLYSYNPNTQVYTEIGPANFPYTPPGNALPNSPDASVWAPNTPTAPASQQTIGPNGYVPADDDVNLLARLLYAEGESTPADMPAFAWATVNRVDATGFGDTLSDVVYQSNQYQSVPGGGGLPDGSAQWQASANPDSLTGDDAAAWQSAMSAAQGVLNGTIPDPTGGAQFFFASSTYDGTPASAYGHWYQQALRNHTLIPSIYRSAYPNTNYFFVSNPTRH